MRKFLITTAAIAGVLAATALVGTAVKAQPYYGGMMGGMAVFTVPATA